MLIHIISEPVIFGLCDGIMPTELQRLHFKKVLEFLIFRTGKDIVNNSRLLRIAIHFKIFH